MADLYSRERRSEIMSHIRSKNTYPERLVFSRIKKLWKSGIRYRKHYARLPGKPDVAFPSVKLAVFIDSEFWHGKNFGKWEKRLPSDFWKKKIKENMRRDGKVDQQLRGLGWKVIRIWSEEIEKNPDSTFVLIDTECKKRLSRFKHLE